MSIVRENIMNREGYTPYCGDMNCKHDMPRTRFVSGQFQCSPRQSGSTLSKVGNQPQA